MSISKPASAGTSVLLHTLEEACEAARSDQPALARRVGSRLDPGIKRKERPNEDSLFVAEDLRHSAAQDHPLALLVVADGMGGHGHGQEASRLAVGSLAGYLSAPPGSSQAAPGALLPLLKAGVKYANQVVYQRNQERGTDMGTTLTAIVISGSTAYIAHVGDSRAYLFREGAGLSQLTQDHSVAAAFAASGVIRPDELYTHPRRNMLYRSLGQQPTLEVDTGVVALRAGDTLLLCSDGLWQMVRDPQIAGILTTPISDPSATAELLVQSALARGGVDNVSVIVVRAREAEKGR